MDELTDTAPALIKQSAKAETTLPPGYDTVEEFLKEARARFNEGADADRENRDAGLEDLKFLTGEQWDEQVKARRKRLKRPVLTINDLPQYIGQVIGDTRANRPAIKVRPVEDADEDLAQIRAGLIRSIENQSNATQVYALAGEDQVGGGLGHFRIGLEYTTDDAFDQDIRIRHIPNPFAVVWDALSVEATGADARFCFVVDEVDRAGFEATYPDATTTELTVPGDGAEWISKDSVRVTEYWLMVEQKRTIALLAPPADPNADPAAQPAGPKIVDITGKEDEARPYIVTGPDGQPRMREVAKKEAWMYLITGAEVLSGPFKYPISRPPIIKVTGREIRVGPKRFRFGLIRFAKDPMRMKNVWRSSAAEWLAMSPKQQYAVHASNPKDADSIRKGVKSGDNVLIYSGINPPQRMDPPTAPAALLQEAQMAAQDIKDVTGLHDASLGMRSNEISGKAIMARERQGDVATFMYHDNLALSIKEGGKVINELIPVAFDTARTILTIGEDEATKVMRVNDPAASGGFIDLTKGKYDIVVDTGPSYSTKRVEAADSMAQALQAMPKLGEVAGDLYVKAQDWPDADIIAKRLLKSMPPGLVEEEGDQSDPAVAQQRQQAAQVQQQQAQAAQQMQAMAMRRAELELEEQEARTRQAQANADKAIADAEKAKVEMRTFRPGAPPPRGQPAPGGEVPAL